MINYDYEIKTLNVILSKLIKKDNENITFIRIHPLTYINNRINPNIFFNPSELVYIKTKTPLSIIEKGRLKKDVLKLINQLLSFIGVYYKKDITSINFKVI